jgi:hypothetical protein
MSSPRKEAKKGDYELKVDEKEYQTNVGPRITDHKKKAREIIPLFAQVTVNNSMYRGNCQRLY